MLVPEITLLHCEDPNITLLSSPAMRASIFLLLVACTAFAAATSCPEGRTPCTEEGLLSVTECAKGSKMSMLITLVGWGRSGDLERTCQESIENDMRNYRPIGRFALLWTHCIYPAIKEKYGLCLNGTTEQRQNKETPTPIETKECFDQVIKEALNPCDDVEKYLHFG